MSNTTTWILELKDQLTGPIRQVQNTLSKVMGGASASISSVTKQEDKLNASVKTLNAELGKTNFKSFDVQPIRQVTNEVDRLNNELKSTNNVSPSNDFGFGRIKSLIGGIFVAQTIGNFASSVVDVTGEFQKYEAVLTNTFKSSEKAKESMTMLQEFATTTPFQLSELTDSYVKLVNRGFEPSTSELKSMGDLASSTGKSFDQLTEAMLDAQTGEFERLKEFGVVAKSMGDKVVLNFKGQAKEIAKTPEAIKQALIEFGNLDGVKGSSDAIINTLPGAISNLQDSWDRFKVSLGMGGSPFITGLVKSLTDFVGFLTQHKDLVLGIISAITIGIGGAAIAMGGYAAITVISKIATMSFAEVMTALNAVVAANPFVFIAAAIAVAVGAIMLAWNKFEGFRKFVFGMWGSIKAVFSAMWDTVKNFFGGLADMISALVNRDWDGLKAGASKFAKGLSGANPVGFAGQYGDDIKEAWKEGKDQGAKSFQSSKEKNKPSTIESLIKNDKPPIVTMPVASKSAGNSSNASGTSLASGRNVTVTINGGIAPNLTIITNNIQEGTSRLKQMIAEALLSAVHDSEIALANG